LTARGRLGDTGGVGSKGWVFRFLGVFVGEKDRVVDCEEAGRRGWEVVSSWVDLIALHATRVVTVTEDAVDAPDFAVFEGEKNEMSEDEQETEESIANRAHPPCITAFSCPRVQTKYLYLSLRVY